MSSRRLLRGSLTVLRPPLSPFGRQGRKYSPRSNKFKDLGSSSRQVLLRASADRGCIVGHSETVAGIARVSRSDFGERYSLLSGTIFPPAMRVCPARRPTARLSRTTTFVVRNPSAVSQGDAQTTDGDFE